MRIVGGSHRGRSLKAPGGTVTRPTADRVRESVFSSLEARGCFGDDTRVLDAFAGSGALGLEALSRGAAHATFVERDSSAIRVIGQNIEALGFEDQSSVIRMDVFRALRRPLAGAPFALLFLDPPYRIESAEVSRLVRALIDNGSLTEGAAIVWEHDAKTDIAFPTDVETMSDRRYGSTAVTILRRRGGMDKQ